MVYATWHSFSTVTYMKTQSEVLKYERPEIEGNPSYIWLSSPHRNGIPLQKRIAIYYKDGSFYTDGGLRNDYAARPALYQEGTTE